MTTPNSFRAQPDERGHFGAFGGRYVAETLMPLILDLDREYRAAKADPAFQTEFDSELSFLCDRIHVKEDDPMSVGHLPYIL